MFSLIFSKFKIYQINFDNRFNKQECLAISELFFKIRANRNAFIYETFFFADVERNLLTNAILIFNKYIFIYELEDFLNKAIIQQKQQNLNFDLIFNEISYKKRKNHKLKNDLFVIFRQKSNIIEKKRFSSFNNFYLIFIYDFSICKLLSMRLHRFFINKDKIRLKNMWVKIINDDKDSTLLLFLFKEKISQNFLKQIINDFFYLNHFVDLNFKIFPIYDYNNFISSILYNKNNNNKNLIYFV